MFEERDKSAAFGTGTTPPTIDIERIKRVEDWLLTAKPPPFRQHFPVDDKLAKTGAGIYKGLCARCHGASGEAFALPAAEQDRPCLQPGESDAALYAPQVGKITRWESIGTDRLVRFLYSYTHDLAVNQSTLYAGYPWRFCHFRKTHGYANMPLDGLWLRAPYLHNGSVPTLRDLLEPAAQRPAESLSRQRPVRPAAHGLRRDAACGRRAPLLQGGYPRGRQLERRNNTKARPMAPNSTAQDKNALLEYLKTF